MARNRVTGLGGYNAICDVCGFKFKASELRRRWDGAMVDQACFESRHPQDFIRVIPDQRPLVFISPDSDAPLTYSPTWGLFSGTAGSGFWESGFWTTNFWTSGFWTEGGIAGSAGNSEILSTYTEVTDVSGNNVVNVSIYAVIGSTAVFASGPWTISVPIANGGHAATGEAMWLIQGTRSKFGTVTLPARSTTATIRSTDTGAQWSDTVPHTISAGDYFSLSIRYGTTP